ncbi:hypothetical protein Tco_1329726 [Tanacetum coccineum]
MVAYRVQDCSTEKIGLPVRPDCHLVGFTRRLDYQKGIDIILSATPALLQDDVQFVNCVEEVVKSTVTPVRDAWWIVDTTYAAVDAAVNSVVLGFSCRTKMSRGITNGIDVTKWDPSSYEHITSYYTVNEFSRKIECKIALQKKLGLPVCPDCPLVDCVEEVVKSTVTPVRDAWWIMDTTYVAVVAAMNIIVSDSVVELKCPELLPIFGMPKGSPIVVVVSVRPRKLIMSKPRLCVKALVPDGYLIFAVSRIWYDKDVHNLRSVENEFPAIAFNDSLKSSETLSCEPTVTSLNDEIDFKISFDYSDDEDYMVIFDKNSFSYKIISTNDLKTDSENDNEKVNMPLFPSPEPTVNCFDDLDFFKDFENEFLVIVYNDAPTSKSDLLTEPILSPQHIDEFDSNDETSLSEFDEEEQNVLYFNDIFPFNIIHTDDLKSEKDNDDNEIDIIQSLGDYECCGGQDMALPPRDQRHQYLRYEGLQYTNADIADFETRLARIYMREIVFTSLAWRWLFDIRGPLVHEIIMEIFNMFRFAEAVIDLDTAGALQFQLGGVRRRMSWREFILALGLHTTEEMHTIGFARDFLGITPSYTSIRDPILRLCHKLITCSIARRSQAPEKVTMTDLFYLRGMDVGLVNVPYLLARYLRFFAARRKSGALISGGQFIARLAEHFGLLAEERLRRLTVTAPTLPVIDMAELHDAAAGVPGVVKDAPAVDNGDQAISKLVQAPPPPPAAARTMPQRMARLEEDVHEIRGALAEQHEVIGAMARDFSRFTVWAVSGIAQLLDSARVTYTPYSDTHTPYQRRIRRKTGEASTSATQQDQQQHDP